MKRSYVSSCIVTLSLLAALGGSMLQAQDIPGAPGNDTLPASQISKQHLKRMPFRGSILKVDQKKKTFTLKGRTRNRVFRIVRGTKLVKHGEPAHFADILKGEKVGGVAWILSKGEYETISLRIGPKRTTGKAPPVAPKKGSTNNGADSAPRAAPLKAGSDT